MSSSAISPTSKPLKFGLIVFSLLFAFSLSVQAQAPIDPPPNPPDTITPPVGDPPTLPGDPPSQDPGTPPNLIFSELINVSTRGKVDIGPGEDFNVGFAIREGDGTTLVAQAIGAGGLGAFLPGVDMLENPQITVFQVEDVNGAVNPPLAVGSNTNYSADPNVGLLNGTSLDPETGSLPLGANDASLVLIDLPIGNYTIQVTDESGDSGVVLSGVSFLNGSGFSEDTTNLINVSTRGKVDSGPGEDFNVGFAVRGNTPKNIVCQAIGSGGLAPFLPGVTLLSNPQISVFQLEDENGVVQNPPLLVGTNDNWADDPNLVFIRGTSFDPETGSLPLGANDSSLLLELTPGNYTIQVTDVGGGSGVVLAGASEIDI